MSTRKPMRGGAHPPYGETRRLECPNGHAAGLWWRPASGAPFEPVEPAELGTGDPCPACGAELVDVRALIDGAPEEVR